MFYFTIMASRFVFLFIASSFPFLLFAQNYDQVALIKVGTIDTPYTTITRILSNPRVISTDRNCQVAGFSVSFVVDDGVALGPYVTTGAELTDEQKIKIKELSKGKLKVIIDQVRVICNGDPSQEIWSRPIILWCNY